MKLFVFAVLLFLASSDLYRAGAFAMGDDAHDLCSTNLPDDLRHYLDECSARSGGAASYSHFHNDC